MTAFGLAWRTARRYRARAVLAVVGVAVIGALNLDMLMLSRGLLLSFADLVNSTGYDIRIAGAGGMPLTRQPIDNAGVAMTQIAGLPEIAAVATMRTATAAALMPNRRPDSLELIGSSDPAGLGIWHPVSGSDLKSKKLVAEGRTEKPSETSSVETPFFSFSFISTDFLMCSSS